MPDAALIATNSFRRSYSPVPARSGRRGSDQQTHSPRRRVGSPFSARERCVEDLRERVVEALVSLGYPSLVTVVCEVASDRIVLSGTLTSYHLKQMAQVAALRVAGLGRVDNRVIVTTP